MACGIYQITNKVNGKFYIGQSRNIKKRWRQHTRGLDKSNALSTGSYPLRAAFIKYGLDKFDFKVIEECPEEQLLSRETFWIQKKKPAYNCNINTPVRKRKKSQQRVEPRYWVQYHNYENLGHLPSELELDFDDVQYDSNEFMPGISTSKRAVLDAVGDTVFLIVGIGEHPKQYYLWSQFIIEEVQIAEDHAEGETPYDAFGDGYLMSPPQLLNSNNFNKFKKHCGNFGFGFMNIVGSPYTAILNQLAEQYKVTQIEFAKHVEDFYTSVTKINPHESAAYSRRGIIRHLAISLYPDDAILTLAGAYTKLITFGITEPTIKYRGRLLIHTLSYYEEIQDQGLYVELKANCLNVLEAFELNQETFPANAIQGWIEVANVFKYDQNSFSDDSDIHGRGDDLVTYKAEMCMPEEYDVWCIDCVNPVIFEKAILIDETQDVYEGQPWFPYTLSEINAFRYALNRSV